MGIIATVQMVSSDQVTDNLATCQTLLEQCAHAQAEVVLLPENFAAMVNQDQDRLAIAEKEGDGPIQQFVQEQAKRLGLWIVAGTIPLKSENPAKTTASCLVYDAKGQRQARYDKVHLFDVTVKDSESYLESSHVAPGHSYCCVDTPIGRVGLSVCYDLRFPEQFRQLMQQGAEIFVVPSAFTETTGQVHWQCLLQARAIENLSFVAAANQGGTHRNGRKTYGHSMVIAPWGNILNQLDYGQGVITSPIDLEQLYYRRQHFPCLNHLVD